VQATGNVAINFTAAGYTRYDQQFYVIDGTTYGYWDTPTFHWEPGTTHTVAAVTPITNWDGAKYIFGSWTNGNGLTTASGTFTTPSSDTTVTLNYVQATYAAHFAVSGTSNFDGDILKIDGVNYPYSSLASTPFSWDAGSTHTVEALGPVYSWDTPPREFVFTSWTNGNGLTTASGTFTMPTQDVTVTANYVSSTVQVLFRHSGLSNLNTDTVLTIDGVTYDYWQVLNTNFQLTPGSTHTVTAASSLTGWDSVTHYFTGWTNGNGLTVSASTFTVPSSDVTVTANYDTTPPTPEQTATSITISCSDLNELNQTVVAGVLLSGGAGLSGKTVTLTYYDGASWHSIGQATTQANGSYSCNWLVPSSIILTAHPVKADFAGEGNYLESTASAGSPSYTPPMEVLPENIWGSLVGLVACFGAALVFFKVRTKSPVKSM
jgi:uncharacterized repeat protein (TIGR02543 family)